MSDEDVTGGCLSDDEEAEAPSQWCVYEPASEEERRRKYAAEFCGSLPIIRSTEEYRALVEWYARFLERGRGGDAETGNVKPFPIGNKQR